MRLPIKPARYKIGDKVRVVGPGRLVGMVREIQLSHSKHFNTLYYVYVPLDPEPLIIPAREEELEAVSSDHPLGAASPSGDVEARISPLHGSRTQGERPTSGTVKPPVYKVGDKVRVVGPGRLVGMIREVQRAVTPNGTTLYHVYIPLDPEPLIVPAREEELEAVPSDHPLGAALPSRATDPV
jgi:hypothetical protein